MSILPPFKKNTGESNAWKRLLSFINKNDILYKYQFAFRAKHGPNIALMLIVDNILQALEKGEFVISVFIDFSQAFDTVNHDILFR